MTRRRRHLMTISLLLIAALPAEAAAGEGYAGAQAGMFLPIKSNVTGDFIGDDARVTYNPGVVLTLLGGYQFDKGIRAEGEVNYRRLSTDRLYTGSRELPVDSDVRSYGFMANLYYDFKNRTVLTPFIGGGVGLAVVRFGKATSGAAPLWSSDEDVNIAYQGIAGFALKIADDTSLDFVYHHFAIPRLHFDQLSAEFRGINVSVGIRHWF
jgi:opacity protein-like surface antigen